MQNELPDRKQLTESDLPPSAFTRGAQIIFIPYGQTDDHPQARRGFVTSAATPTPPGASPG